MSKQPEALRLAKQLGQMDCLNMYENKILDASAAELRRLHEVNQELVEALEYVRDVLGPHHGWADDSKRMIEAAIAKAKGESNG